MGGAGAAEPAGAARDAAVVAGWLGAAPRCANRSAKDGGASSVEGDPDRVGEVPLPPYMHAKLADPERYQTVFARRARCGGGADGGLHLTEALLDALSRSRHRRRHDRARGRPRHVPARDRGARRGPRDAHRGVRRSAGDDGGVRAARRGSSPIGTTVVRALEATAATGALEGRTDLFITRGFSFQVVDVLLTNFHVPRSTLLALVDAFMGPRWRELYDVALASGYRFLSFGDAMLVERARR